jgi:hypothetical protein
VVLLVVVFVIEQNVEVAGFYGPAVSLSSAPRPATSSNKETVAACNRKAIGLTTTHFPIGANRN